MATVLVGIVGSDINKSCCIIILTLHTCTHTHACMHACTHACTHTHTHACTHTPTHARTPRTHTHIVNYLNIPSIFSSFLRDLGEWRIKTANVVVSITSITCDDQVLIITASALITPILGLDMVSHITLCKLTSLLSSHLWYSPYYQQQ